MVKKELKQLALNDLARSGLDVKDYKKMEITPCDEETTNLYMNRNVNSISYLIPYFDINGKIFKPTFIRFRFLEDVLNSKGKLTRYSQPKGTGVKIYFPPCIDWKKICKDTSITICVTEGEKKAYKACKEGIPTIGLGGVNSFTDKITKKLIKDFKNINLKDRKILICYDNDLHSNDEVIKAANKLAIMLFNKGARVFNKILPFNPYQKIGLDDYLLKNSVKDFNLLNEKEFHKVASINKLNNEVAYINEVGKFYIFKDRLFVSEKHLSNIKYANKTIADDRGNQISIAEGWVQSEQRREHKRLTYKPAQPEVTKDNEYNLWSGWGCTPEKGSIKTFISAVDKIFNNDKEIIKWFLDWVAYPIQHPATKMLSAVLLQSVHQGTGKSTIGLVIGSMYGDNFRVVNDKQLHAPFNEWAINKQFILGDEVSGKDKRNDSDFIKNMVTQETVSINKKYSPSYDIPDCMNYLLTSNHVDAWYLEIDDRRAFVHNIKKEWGLTLKEGIALEKFRNGKGKDHLLNYFIYEHKIAKDFDHRARPPMTEAKRIMMGTSLTDIERFIEEVKEDPDHMLITKGGTALKCDLFTTKEIIKIYEDQNDNATANGTNMGKALNKMLVDCETYSVRTLQGVKILRALRNTSKWNKATPQEKREHYNLLSRSLNKVKKKSKLKIVK